MSATWVEVVDNCHQLSLVYASVHYGERGSLGTEQLGLPESSREFFATAERLTVFCMFMQSRAATTRIFQRETSKLHTGNSCHFRGLPARKKSPNYTKSYRGKKSLLVESHGYLTRHTSRSHFPMSSRTYASEGLSRSTKP